MNKIDLFKYKIIPIGKNKVTRLVFDKIEKSIGITLLSINLRGIVGQYE